ncbi:unnamed protein product, partial [Didymodactylos carnosus]
FEIATGSQPFVNDKIFELYDKIQKWQPQIPEQTLGPDIREFISLLLKQDLRQRPRSYRDILDMPVISSVAVQPSNEEIQFVTMIIENLPQVV